jgi:photosynthetic reaction center H subunit
MQHENRNNVVPLDDLDDFEVADNSPDVRGWDVVTREGRRVGEVEELLVDTSAMKVRYLDIELDDEVRRSDSDRRVLIPVGQARLDDRDDRVLVDNMSVDQFRTLPTYNGRLDRQYEDSLRSHFGAAGAGGAAGAAGVTRGAAGTSRDRDYYADDHFDDSRFYGARRGTGEALRSRGRDRDRDRHDREGSSDRMTLSEEELAVGKREHEAGSVRVGKHVETEHVERDVPVTRERAEIERRPIPEGERMSARTRIENDEIRVPLSEEEVVVEKRTVPKEELVVRKSKVQDTEHVEADLRKERADIDAEGDIRRTDEGRGRNR